MKRTSTADMFTPAAAPEAELPGIPEDSEIAINAPFGSLWQIAGLGGRRHRLFVGDATLPAAYKRLMGGRRIDLLLTDPPYNLAGNTEMRGVGKLRPKSYGALKAADWDQDWNLEAFAAAVDGFLAPDCTVYLWTSHYLFGRAEAWVHAWAKHVQFVVWQKDNPMPSLAKCYWTSAAELAVVGYRGRHVFNFPEQGHALNVFHFGRGGGDTAHPTQKPVPLFRHCIRHSSSMGALVVDPHCGSGTAILAAEAERRECYAMEIDPHWAGVILTRCQLVGMTVERLAYVG